MASGTRCSIKWQAATFFRFPNASSCSTWNFEGGTRKGSRDLDRGEGGASPHSVFARFFLAFDLAGDSGEAWSATLDPNC